MHAIVFARLCLKSAQVARAANALAPFTPEGFNYRSHHHSNVEHEVDPTSSSPYRHPINYEEEDLSSSSPPKRQVPARACAS